jgi:hypothetical protein
MTSKNTERASDWERDQSRAQRYIDAQPNTRRAGRHQHRAEFIVTEQERLGSGRRDPWGAVYRPFPCSHALTTSTRTAATRIMTRLAAQAPRPAAS